MLTDNAAALVGAGMLSILLFPIAALISRRNVTIPASVAPTPIENIEAGGLAFCVL